MGRCLTIERKANNEEPLRQNSFNLKIEDELEGSHYTKNVVKNQNGTESVVYELTIEQCTLIGMRESKSVRRTVLEKLKQLENHIQLPNFTDPAEAAIAWAKEYKEKQALAIENSVLKPKADALDVISAASNSLNIRETAKTLDIQEKKFIAWCINHDWLYRDSKAKLCPISHRIQSGFLEQRAVSYIKPNSEVGVSTQAMFTARALTHLAKIFAVVKEVV